MKILLNNTILFESLRPFNDLGFVPTMGGIHNGHLSLINKSKKLCKKTIVSIFINPKQFNKKKDLKDCLFGTNGKKYKDVKLINRKSGSAALDMAYVASGRYDGFFQENLNLWDIASGVIIISEAGGIINKADIRKINDIEVITSSSNINEKMLNILDKF